MNAELLYSFLDRFTNNIKLDYCFGICKLIMIQMENSSREDYKALHETWEKNIRERFEFNVKNLEENESITEQDKIMLNAFLENLIKEINS